MSRSRCVPFSRKPKSQNRSETQNIQAKNWSHTEIAPDGVLFGDPTWAHIDLFCRKSQQWRWSRAIVWLADVGKPKIYITGLGAPLLFQYRNFPAWLHFQRTIFGIFPRSLEGHVLALHVPVGRLLRDILWFQIVVSPFSICSETEKYLRSKNRVLD